MGVMGAEQAQYCLPPCFICQNGLVVNPPKATIPAAGGKFDAAGNRTDQARRDFSGTHLAAFKARVLRMR